MNSRRKLEKKIQEKNEEIESLKRQLAEAKSLHLDEILKRIGREVNRETKGALAGTLGCYPV
jgi:predicted  nucleic acid-binding Zn-ribbon protein